jgi:hypothetical protein
MIANVPTISSMLEELVFPSPSLEPFQADVTSEQHQLKETIQAF